MELTFTQPQISLAAIQIFDAGKDCRVWAFRGEMGAGKTTLIKAICHHMQVSSTVASPTYSIINEYRSEKGNVFHIDLYRLRDMDEVLQAGVEECIISGHYCFIEWPDKAPGLLPLNTFYLSLSSIDENTRKIITAFQAS